MDDGKLHNTCGLKLLHHKVTSQEVDGINNERDNERDNERIHLCDWECDKLIPCFTSSFLQCHP